MLPIFCEIGLIEKLKQKLKYANQEIRENENTYDFLRLFESTLIFATVDFY